MKTPTTFIKVLIMFACLVFIANRNYAQTAVRSTITVNQATELPVKTIPDIGNNGYKQNFGSYPLKISNTDTLFFYSAANRDFVKNGITAAGITSITKVALSRVAANGRRSPVDYGGRAWNYYYFCNGINNGYFTVDGLTNKQNSTFSVSYSASNKLYTVIRNYNGKGYSETVSNYLALANSQAADFNGFNGTEYIGDVLMNVGTFYFYLSRQPVVVLKAPVISAGGPTTFTAGGSVTLTSTAPTNTWYNGATVIAGATGASYTATTSGTYTVKTTAAGFNNMASNAIVVTVNPAPPVITPLTVGAGGKIINHSGTAVLLQGVNAGIYGSGFVNDLSAVSNAIKNNSKVNSIRIIWESQNAVNTLNASDPGYNPAYYTLPNLDAALNTYTQLHILPVLCLHDLTDVCTYGGTLDYNSITAFNNYVVAFWTNPSVIAILKKYQNNLIINLQNEWGATWDGSFSLTAYTNAYKSLIVQLRGLGINCPIMIDAVDGGANVQFMVSNGQTLINNDPIKNVLLSIHTYWSQENGAIVNCPADYTTYIDKLAASGLPFVLGEVSDWAVQGATGDDIPSTPPVSFVCPGTGSPNKYAVDYDAILTEAMKKGVGYMAWSWYQDGNVVRNIYNQSTGTSINTSSQAGIWPADILSTGKTYGLNSASIIPVF
jgi:mannan endo-1,4-beta-mannosidase